MASTQAVSPRGTRPRNRRAQITSAAAALFYERGYDQVSIADVAASVNVGPSALYRHFPSKADLLFEAIDQTIVAFADMVADLPARDLNGIARTAARTALAYRPLGVLWQREARHLPEEHLRKLRRHLRDAVLTLAGTLRELRPSLSAEEAEFLASAGVNAMSSISFHRLALPDADFEQVLADLALRVLSYSFTGIAAADTARRALPAPVGRREEIADAAASLFARHGYDGVGVDDIGAAVGIAGPTLYNHFASKQEVLDASLQRGRALVADTLSTPDDVRTVTTAFVDLARDHSDLVTHVVTEGGGLGAELQNLWAGLLDDDEVVARLKTHAAQMLALSMTRTLYLHGRPGFRQDLVEICVDLQR